MFRLFKGLARWSLEISGASIIWYNYQSEERQQRLRGTFYFMLNSYRSCKFLYRTAVEFKNTLAVEANLEEFRKKMGIFHENTASRLYDLCETNKGIYAKIGEIVSDMNKIVPEAYINKLKKLKIIEE